jgi:predicted CXXCH cytochrome family protein
VSARRLLLACVLSVALAGRGAALDGPHSGVFGDDCMSCHTLHNAPGASLTSVAGNANLCFSCHNVAGNYFGQWNDGTAQAIPGVSGVSHSWSGAATGMGATPPGPGSEMGLRLPGGSLQCSTCHGQHDYSASAGGTQHVSGVARLVGTSGTVTLRPPPAAAIPRGYLLQLAAGGAVGAATFRISHDGRTWLGWSGTAWASGVATGRPTGAPVSLDDPAGVDVEFAGTFAAGDQYRFYVGQKFLRVPNVEGAMCTTCHADRNESWQNVEGSGSHAGTGAPIVPGATVFSHPVGIGMNANGRGYDRAASAVLDADGQPQPSAADGNPSNDLRFSSSGNVTCLSCHAPHNADSNSLSVDPR